MIQYHIGLDFGTYQSKACIFSVNDETHEFFQFSNGTFFLPTRVAKRIDGKFEYGNVNNKTQDIEDYSYFKIAAAEDEEFRTETFDNLKDIQEDFYQFNEYKNFSPEFLSVIYLTFMLFTIKEKYNISNEPKVKTGSILSRFIRRQEEAKDDVRFTIQLGIPTEWSQEKNLRRKRKFENILMLAEILQLRSGTLKSFLDLTANELVKKVQKIYSEYQFPDKKSFETRLHEMGISVYPETAAGLTFILKTKQLPAGYYAIMDIGGGSTDVSFFRIPSENPEAQIRYLASESYIMASNNVYLGYAEVNGSMIKLKKAENEVLRLIESNKWKTNKQLVDSLSGVNNNLQKLLYKLFNKRVYYYQPNGMIKKYEDQPVILYGGGASLPIIKEGRFEIHDHGNPCSLNCQTFMEKQDINIFTSIINILPKDGSWKGDFSLLVVALGLSYIKSSTSVFWFSDIEYKPTDGNTNGTVPHPRNEDCYIYDVLSKNWR